jgi:hypothetical protein
MKPATITRHAAWIGGTRPTAFRPCVPIPYGLRAICRIANQAPAGFATGDTVFFPAPAARLPSMSGSAIRPTAGNLRLCHSRGMVFAANLGVRLSPDGAAWVGTAFAEAAINFGIRIRLSAGTDYKAIQVRSASVTASGRSIVDRWPHSCTMLSFDPAIPSAIVRAAETGVRESSLPTSTSVGQ